ncbi:MAG: tRNA dihydrouridine synthase DusB [Candidatus Omnitrophica bacterium]|nr:tRNA dihydrouridine synthase DusB [Candidatus Omnitrophota bacterium]
MTIIMEKKDKAIGPLKSIIDAKTFLAPLAGVSDLPFRIMARKYGCVFAFTEMIDVNGVYYGNMKTLDMIRTREDHEGLGVQIVGEDAGKILNAAEICQGEGFSLVDINAGCPARKVVSAGKGSALLKEPLKLASILRLLRKKIHITLTLKIRSGWDEANINCIEISRIAEAEGVNAVTVHPRTQKQAFKGKPDHDLTRMVKEAVAIPVFASGNVFSPEDAKTILTHTGCDAVAIARGSFGRPWIFSDTRSFLESGTYGSALSLQGLKKVIEEHFEIALGSFDRKRLFSRMYKHITWYLKGFKGLDPVMRRYTGIKDLEGLKIMLVELEVDERNKLYFKERNG